MEDGRFQLIMYTDWVVLASVNDKVRWEGSCQFWNVLFLVPWGGVVLIFHLLGVPLQNGFFEI